MVDELKVTKKSIADYLKKERQFKCPKCESLFTFPSLQPTINPCPFCKIELIPHNPATTPSSNDEINNKTYVVAVKNKKNQIVNVKTVSKEEFEKIQMQQTNSQTDPFLNMRKINDLAPKDWNPAIVYLMILTSSKTDPITTILESIVLKTITSEPRAFNIPVETKTLLRSEYGWLSEKTSTFPQLVIVYNNYVIEEVEIKELNESVLGNILLNIQSRFFSARK